MAGKRIAVVGAVLVALPAGLVVDRVTAVSAEQRAVEPGYEVIGLDPDGRRISVVDPKTGVKLIDLPIVADVRVEVRVAELPAGGIVVGRFSTRPGTLADLKTGIRVGLGLVVRPDGSVAVTRFVEISPNDMPGMPTVTAMRWSNSMGRSGDGKFATRKPSKSASMAGSHREGS